MIIVSGKPQRPSARGRAYVMDALVRHSRALPTVATQLKEHVLREAVRGNNLSLFEQEGTSAVARHICICHNEI